MDYANRKTNNFFSPYKCVFDMGWDTALSALFSRVSSSLSVFIGQSMMVLQSILSYTKSITIRLPRSELLSAQLFLTIIIIYYYYCVCVLRFHSFLFLISFQSGLEQITSSMIWIFIQKSCCELVVWM